MGAPTTSLEVVEKNVWLRRYVEVSGELSHRLVCFPHAGGSAGVYVPFAKRLARSGIEVHAVQYPGRQERRHEPFAETVGELAAGVLPELRGLSEAPDGVPVSMFGHSMGATVSYETARLLRDAGDAQPTHLFASGRRSPTVGRSETVHLLDDRALLDEVRKLQGTDSRVFDDEDLLRMVMPVLRGDYLVAGRYRHTEGPRLDRPLTALTGDTDPNVPIEEARSWQDVTAGEFVLHVFPGGHFYLQDQMDEVCRTIVKTLGDGDGRAR